MSKFRTIQISEIIADGSTQVRASIHFDTVHEYQDVMEADANALPPVVVFECKDGFILADGFHRLKAATGLSRETIRAEVRKGGKSDALRYALGANSAHGLKRTNADKHRSVELALAEWPKLSDRELARICAVSFALVAEVRKEQVQDSCTSETRTGKDGKQYPAKAKNKGETPQVNQQVTPRVKSADEELTEALGGSIGNVALIEAFENLAALGAAISDAARSEDISPGIEEEWCASLRRIVKIIRQETT